MADANVPADIEAEVFGPAEQEDLVADLGSAGASEIRQRVRLLDNDIRVMKSEVQRLKYELQTITERTKDNKEKIKLNKQLPHLVANVSEILDHANLEKDEDYDEQSSTSTAASSTAPQVTRSLLADDDDNQLDGKAMVVKTTTRQTIFLPVIGLVEPENLKPGELIGVNKDSYLVLDKLPPEYDSRVKVMEVDEKPTDTWTDIGGLDKQIEEMREAIILPMTHKERFVKIGIQPPKGVLMHGPPGTGKTMMARACAANTNATFLKLAGPQLVQMFIGDGAKIVRDAFELAREKAPTIIFIDEIDAIGMKRSGGGELSGVREVQRTMLELLNQLDGFSGAGDVKVIAATNRPDVLDPALLRSGRLDRKIELPWPDEVGRARIMQIHSRRMNYNKDDVNFSELARMTEDFNGAQCKAVCTEGGMEALRRGATELMHEDYVQGINVVQAKKKATLNYYA